MALALASIGVAAFLYLSFDAYRRYDASAAAVTQLTETSKAPVDAAKLQRATEARQGSLRDLVVFADAALFGLIFALLLRKGSTTAPMLLIALPPLMVLFLTVPYGMTGTGLTAIFAAFFTFDPAGFLGLLSNRRAEA